MQIIQLEKYITLFASVDQFRQFVEMFRKDISDAKLGVFADGGDRTVGTVMSPEEVYATIRELRSLPPMSKVFNPVVAFDSFKKRYLKNKDKERIDNSTLQAGSPMYYYCKGCYAHVATLPETHTQAATKYCMPCMDIAIHGLMEDFKERVT